MANVREIKLRIKSIAETRQITKAMKLISAAKLKKARQQLEHTLPYFDKVRSTITDILVHSGQVLSPYFDLRNLKEGKSKCYIVITGDKGLAGGYNHNIIKLTEELIKDKGNPLLLVAGYVGKGYFLRKKYNVCDNFDFPVQNPTIYRARDIAEMVLSFFTDHIVDEVYLVYTELVSSIVIEPKVMKILPLEIEALMKDLGLNDGVFPDIDETLVYEPSAAAVFDILIPKYLKGIIYGALVEAFTSEQSARMAAMDNATANADEMIHKLQLQYNQARQAAITQEISEIVGGAAALQ